ncbi:MAG: GNAT family N-acetyltransferase [Alphaproteobacteria bacterium]|nr:GNAT family N-acetyltransferase [Alphaproteobacteria bacterium]
MTPLLRDEFLTELLGRPSFRVALPEEGPDEACLAAIGAAMREPVFLFARVPTKAVATLRRLESLGFAIVDTGVTLERPAGPVPARAATGLRFARAEDRTAVMALAGASFAYSRLHLDPAVPRMVADRSRAEWAGNFFRGRRGDRMAVIEIEGGIAGFVQLLGPHDGVLTIDLIAIAADFRGRGLAATLIAFAADEVAGVRRLRVGTQIANLPSLRLYEKLGFRMVAADYVLHCHRV